MEPTKQTLICSAVCDFNHVLYGHLEFWEMKYPLRDYPKTIEEYNKRFSLLGLGIKEVADARDETKEM